MDETPLWKHQQAGITLAENVRDLYIAFEMGTGKSRTTIEILRRQYAKKGRLMRTLILCPAIVVSNWRQEFAKYSRIGQQDIILLRGSGKRREKIFLDNCAKNFIMNVPKIVVTNYEALQMEGLVEMIKEWNPEILVCDEAHTLKNHASKRAKILLPIASTAEHRYHLSGTPILNTIEDIFMQYRILDGGEEFGNNFYSFREKYMVDKNAGFASKDSYFPKYEPRAESYQEMQRRIYKKMIRAKKSECLDLPPFVRQQVEVELSPEQRRMYDEMKKNYITWVQTAKQSGEPLPVVAQLAITKALRLQQIVTGYATTETGQTVWMSKNPRLEALEEVLTPVVHDNKVIVWAVFKENYRMISERLKAMKLDFEVLTGEQTAPQKDAAMLRFRTDPKCKVMVANQGAGGVGVNLVEAPYAVYYSKNFSLKDDLQSEARNYRGGSEIHEKITRIDIIAPGTIDELIAEALSNKQEISEKVLNQEFWGKL